MRGGAGLGFTICRRIRDLLAADDPRDWWSQRARDAMAAVHGEHAWLSAAGTAVVTDGSGFSWWTFARPTRERDTHGDDSKACRMRDRARQPHYQGRHGSQPAELMPRSATPTPRWPLNFAPAIDSDIVAALEFADCLPRVVCGADAAIPQSCHRRPHRCLGKGWSDVVNGSLT